MASTKFFSLFSQVPARVCGSASGGGRTEPVYRVSSMAGSQRLSARMVYDRQMPERLGAERQACYDDGDIVWLQPDARPPNA